MRKGINISPKSVWIFGLLFFACLESSLHAQSAVRKFLRPADSLNPKRAWLAGGFTLATYGAFSVGLYQAWYQKTNQSKFHYFNDFGEWNQLDKVAHSYNSYIQTSICFEGARWCGYSERSALIWGSAISTVFQTTIECMDGLSADWGFSWPDMAFNFMGTGLFAGQQLLWKEQKFKLKLSAFPRSYPATPITGDQGRVVHVDDRARQLYGDEWFSKVLKDYNAQTFWLSFNPGVLAPSMKSYWPEWLNLAVGYGSDGLLGGFGNQWTTDGEHFDAMNFRRHRQYYLSLDLDLKKIKTKHPFLKTVLSVFNIVKIPAPALEYNSLGKIRGHWLFF